MDMNEDMTIAKAVSVLKKEYKRALNSSFVQKPLSYALYQTWRHFDLREERRQEEHDGTQIE